MNKAEYAKALDNKWKEYKTGIISNDDFQAQAIIFYDKYLASKHLKDGDLDIFKKILHEAKNLYGLAKDNYYLKKINITDYIWERGLAIGKGISWYDFKMVELGLGAELLPKKDREHFSWKSLKIERQIFPDRLRSPYNMTLCPKENELSAIQTLRVFFELIDFYNQKHVPTLKRDWNIRDGSWVELDAEAEAFDLPYLDIEVTARERAQFERWRDGTGGLGE